MAGDPTPMDYDEPIHHVEWGVMVNGTDEAARLLSEHTARLAVEGRDDLTMVKREVVYHPWVVVPKRVVRGD